MNNINSALQKYLEKNQYRNIALKAVLFDMDGVLYDSMRNHAQAWEKIMKAHGLKMTKDDAYLHEGRTSDETINLIAEAEGKSVSAEEKKQIYKEKAAMFNSYPAVSTMKGSSEILRKVTEGGLSSILVTGSGQPSLLEALNNDFPGVFVQERMVTSYDVKKGKPNPEPYLLGLEKGGLKPSEAIVVENAPLGVTAAHAAGIFTIAVNTGPLPDSILLDAGADILFPSVEVLCNEWENIIHAIEKL